MTNDMTVLLEEAAPALLFAQELPPRPVYTLKDLGVAESAKTIHRRIKTLLPLGLATYNRGRFSIKREVVSQPLNVLKKLLPSLMALKQARRFGRSYSNADINFFLNHLPKTAMITLDYQASNMTKFQTPRDLYVYVDDVKKTATFLKENNFSEGEKGRIVLLQKIGSFDDKVQRVFLDCLANGGRSVLDAVAIQLLYGDAIHVKARFQIETVIKVQNDLPREE